GLSTFIAFIAGACLYMVKSDKDSLEDPNYYQNSLTYDEVYSSMQNLIDDRAIPSVQVLRDTLFIDFKTANNRAERILKRPSDDQLDMSLPFETQKYYGLSASGYDRGSWRLGIKWSTADKTYISEHNLYYEHDVYPLSVFYGLIWQPPLCSNVWTSSSNVQRKDRPVVAHPWE